MYKGPLNRLANLHEASGTHVNTIIIIIYGAFHTYAHTRSDIIQCTLFSDESLQRPTVDQHFCYARARVRMCDECMCASACANRTFH